MHTKFLLLLQFRLVYERTHVVPHTRRRVYIYILLLSLSPVVLVVVVVVVGMNNWNWNGMDEL